MQTTAYRYYVNIREADIGLYLLCKYLSVCQIMKSCDTGVPADVREMNVKMIFLQTVEK